MRKEELGREDWKLRPSCQVELINDSMHGEVREEEDVPGGHYPGTIPTDQLKVFSKHPSAENTA